MQYPPHVVLAGSMLKLGLMLNPSKYLNKADKKLITALTTLYRQFPFCLKSTFLLKFMSAILSLYYSYEFVKASTVGLTEIS